MLCIDNCISYCIDYHVIMLVDVIHLIDDDTPAGNLLFAQSLQQPPGLVDPQHSGDCGNDEFCEFLIPKKLLHHHHAILQFTKFPV